MHVIEKQHAFVPTIFLKKQFITTKVYYTTRNEPVQSSINTQFLTIQQQKWLWKQVYESKYRYNLDTIFFSLILVLSWQRSGFNYAHSGCSDLEHSPNHCPIREGELENPINSSPLQTPWEWKTYFSYGMDKYYH